MESVGVDRKRYNRWQMSYKEVRRDTTLQGSLIKEAQWTVVYTLNLTTRLANFRIVKKHKMICGTEFFS